MDIERKDIIKKLKSVKDFSNIKIIKQLGVGVEGTVYLIRLKDELVALKVNEILNQDKINVKKLTVDKSLETEGLTEFYSTQLINLLITKNISPNFVYNYHTEISKNNRIFYFNEYIKGDVLRNFFKKMKKKKLLTKELIFNIFFQILSGLYALSFQFNMIHADLHFENILISEHKSGGYWKYIINEHEYYIPNLGYTIYINDYGYAMIPKILGKKWYKKSFENIIDTNKYNFYDLLLVKFEMMEYFSPHFALFFNKYFNYRDWDRDAYLKNSDIPYFPQDLQLLDIIELLFRKNDITNCKDFNWYCYDEKPSGDLLATYDMDEIIDSSVIDNILYKSLRNIQN